MRRLTLQMGVVAVMGVILAFGAIACGDDDDTDDGNGNGDGAEATTVAVTLKEFEILPDADSVPAGTVTFRATNQGPADPHELVVIRTDLERDALPTDDTGKVDEDQVDVLGEIEELDVDANGEITLEMSEGAYVLICNIVEDEGGETESHYLNGMRTAFTVE